jgi:hypothetical protein
VDTPPPPPPPLAEKAPRGDGAVESSNPLAHAGPKNERQQAVVDAFKWAWKAYKTDAWGKDELKPISHSSETWFNLGLTLIDSLDTMLLMGMTDEWVPRSTWVPRLAQPPLVDRACPVGLPVTSRVQHTTALGGGMHSPSVPSTHSFYWPTLVVWGWSVPDG